MTTDSARRWRLAAWVIGVGAVMVFAGVATFDQWAALVAGLFGS